MLSIRVGKIQTSSEWSCNRKNPGHAGESIPETYYLMRKEIHNCEENGNNQRNDQNVFEALFAISQAVAFHSQVAKPKQTKNKRN